MPSPNSQRRYLTVLACISLAVLVVGSLLRPHTARRIAAETAPQVTLLQTEIERLKRSAENAARPAPEEFARATAAAARHLLRLPSLRRTGISWGAQRMVVTAKPENSPLAALPAAAGKTTFTASPALWSPGVPIGAAWLPAGAPAAATVAVPANLHPGDWLLAVALQASGATVFEPGRYSGSALENCGSFPFHAIHTSVPLASALLGGGLFDLAGNLVGLIARCDDQLVVFAVQDIVAAMDGLSDPARQIRNRYGVLLSDLDDAEKSFFGVSGGVLVETVWQGWPAHSAGLLPGDVITAVGGQALDGSSSLPPPAAGTALRLSVLRRRQRREVNLPATPPAGPGLQLRDSAGVVVESVEPGGPAARAGLRSGDRILSLDYRPALSPQEVQRRLSSVKRPVFLLLARGDSLTAALVQP
ncbi:MAG TPA: PDZ domain-containing protein [Terriglobales bacterium]|nr:PDZ domain-containing protein [Terriglobales bacterium]